MTTPHQKVLIVDFGSQVTQLIARRLREASVYCEIHPFQSAEAALASGYADLVAFGKAFISMPDLAARIRRGGPYQGLERATMYGGGAHGYTDYPALAN